MNFEDYKNMKNSSHQENFSAKGLAKTAKQATEVIKKLAHTGWNLGEKELKAASRNKTMHSITRPIAFGTAPITSTVRAILGKPTTKYAKLAKELQKKGELKNLIGRGAILGTGAGVISISALIASSGIDDSKYYIFNEETSTIIGSKSGYKTKAEALKVRDEKYPGERINLGKTLKLKYKGDKNFSEMQNFGLGNVLKAAFNVTKKEVKQMPKRFELAKKGWSNIGGAASDSLKAAYHGAAAKLNKNPINSAAHKLVADEYKNAAKFKMNRFQKISNAVQRQNVNDAKQFLKESGIAK